MRNEDSRRRSAGHCPAGGGGTVPQGAGGTVPQGAGAAGPRRICRVQIKEMPKLPRNWLQAFIKIAPSAGERCAAIASVSASSLKS